MSGNGIDSCRGRSFIGGYGHRLRFLAKLKNDVQCDGSIRANHQVYLFLSLKSRRSDFEIVLSDRKIRKQVESAGVGVRGIGGLERVFDQLSTMR